MPKRIAAVLAFLVLCQSLAVAGVEGTKAAYMGGTAAEFQGIKSGIEGVFDTTNDTELLFHFRVNKADHTFSIPYASVVSLEYGQKPGMMSLFSRKRMHYLTIGYRDAAGKDQVAVFELGKRIVRPTLVVVELRTGKKVQLTN